MWTNAHRALHSLVLAGLTRALRHGAEPHTVQQLVPIADRAVQLAEAAGDPAALATAKLALHDALWQPGTARARLPVVDEMLAAAIDAGDQELVALAHQLRAAALIELGDPAGRDELLRFVTLAERPRARPRPVGSTHPAGRLRADRRARGRRGGPRRRRPWNSAGRSASRTRRAASTPCADRWSHSAARSRRTCWAGRTRCGRCFRCSGPGRRPSASDLDAAREALGDFSVLDVIVWTGLEALAVAAVVFAAVGSPEQCRWAYQRLLPFAGTHVVVGGCASYHAAVDHHLGALAAALGDRTNARGSLRECVDDASPARGRGLGTAVAACLEPVARIRHRCPTTSSDSSTANG